MGSRPLYPQTIQIIILLLSFSESESRRSGSIAQTRKKWAQRWREAQAGGTAADFE